MPRTDGDRDHVDRPDDLGVAVSRLVDRIDALQQRREEDRALVDELLDQLARGGTPTARRPPVYGSWVAWVEEWLTPRVSRFPHRYRWCHSYALHPEVADRLEALWQTWERQWPEPAQRVTWFRDSLDPQLAIITAEDGPLRECSASERQHSLPAALGELGATAERRRADDGAVPRPPTEP